MFPENGPAKTTSKAEKRIYALLAEALGDDYAVFHGLHWETRERDDQLAKRESDFLIISRTHGLLILEAKGGHIRRGDATGTYFTKASSGRRAQRPTRDPFEQARSLVPLLERHLWTAPLTLPYAPTYRIGHGVWFPDTEWRRGARTAADDEIVLDRLDLDAPEAGLLRVYAHFERASGVPAPLGDEALAALYQTLAPTVQVQSRLAVQIEGEARRIQELTAEQFAILQALGRYRRLAVSGAAGTGKTVLAYEKARRLAAQGLDVLLLCSNPSLARWLDARAKLEPAELWPHLVVHDVDALCAWVLTLAGTLKGTKDGGEETGGPERSAALAELLLTAIRTLERRGERMPFDAILVDEAQDLDRPLWEPILTLLRDRADGLCYAFYDEAQREADGGWRLPLPADTTGEKPLLPLVVNLRNTRAIFDVMMRFYHGPDAPICHGPAGRAPMYLDPGSLPAPLTQPLAAISSTGDAPAEGDEPALGADDVEVTALRLALDHLVGADGILPEEILVITCRSQRRSRWYTAENRRIGAHRLIQRPEGGRPGRVALSTVRSAKGLERKVVILTELDGLEGAARRDALLYVALSRAVHHLVVLGPEKALQPRKQGVLAIIRGRR
jgi:hypothetical protein